MEEEIFPKRVIIYIGYRSNSRKAGGNFFVIETSCAPE